MRSHDLDCALDDDHEGGCSVVMFETSAPGTITSLRTQLQQAEQERDAAKHELEVIENFGVLPLYNALLAEHSETVAQLQQAEARLGEAEKVLQRVAFYSGCYTNKQRRALARDFLASSNADPQEG